DRSSTADAAALRRVDPARWRSASFFVTQLLFVDERPDHPVVHAQAPLGQLADQTAQGELAIPAAMQQPIPVLANKLLRAISAYLAWRHTAGLTVPVDPIDRRADRHLEAGCRLIARQAVPLDRLNHSLPKVHRIRFRHPC